MLDLSEFRVAGNDSGVLSNGAGKDKAIGIRDAVFGLKLGGLIDHFIGNGEDGKS